jgi:hypothetical protein
MGEAMGPPSEHEDFSVVLGGPLYQFCMRTRLMRPTLGWVNRRITVSLLLTWVPLALLSALSGTLASGVAVPFLLDLTNLRLLVALPLMIGAEVFIHRRMRKVAQNFIDHGLISPTDQPRFEALIARTMWLRNSVVAELLMLVMSFTGGYALWRSFVTLGQIDTWYVVVRDGSIHFASLVLPVVRLVHVCLVGRAVFIETEPIAPRPSGWIGLSGTIRDCVCSDTRCAKHSLVFGDRRSDLACRRQVARFSIGNRGFRCNSNAGGVAADVVFFRSDGRGQAGRVPRNEFVRKQIYGRFSDEMADGSRIFRGPAPWERGYSIARRSVEQLRNCPRDASVASRQKYSLATIGSHWCAVGASSADDDPNR